ncbi:hypothetical protein DM01DRAFT_1337104 [Hesseltinella vesiculosa]|uniref:Uncharacterized protein n=1 Tax=Hesseltinella vesiculosa TaxID=101127 RepID=A0A1X2GDX2_9FUNG|nr:hypothetical protein DM01DRAFT_1337104 [Hesseltinella vesiculosa]
MKKLSFHSFHTQHFNPQLTRQWQQYIQAQYDPQDVAPVPSQLNDHPSQDPPEDAGYLPQEVIDIFAFSEAYAKEKEKAEQEEEEASYDHEQDWSNHYSTVLCHDGIEAPADTLIVVDELSSSKDTRALEHQLNSDYMEHCRTSPGTLWPVLPLRL